MPPPTTRLFPAETAALREERCFLNYTGTGYKNAICPLQRIQCGAGGADILLAGLPDLKLGKAWQTHGHALPPEGHATIQHLLAGKVERPGTGLGGKGGDVGGRYACAHQYLHFLPGSFHQLPQQGSTLRVTTDNLSARLHGTRQALETLQEQGVEQIQFVTTLKTTTLSVEDLLAEGGQLVCPGARRPWEPAAERSSGREPEVPDALKKYRPLTGAVLGNHPGRPLFVV